MLEHQQGFGNRGAEDNPQPPLWLNEPAPAAPLLV
jgi:hypothetical protein